MPRKNHTPSVRHSLGADRLSLAGPAAFDPAQWITRLSALALLAGVVWAGFSALRPLPAPQLAEAPSPSTITASLTPPAALESRETQLAQLNRVGNIFSPDRKDWPSALTRSDDASQPDASPDATPAPAGGAESLAVADAASRTARPPRYEDIAVVKKPPVAIWKDLQDLRLRGVYRTDQGAIALIGNIRQKERSRSHARHAGEYFEDEDGDWTVLAIDEVGKRVILSRGGMNVELTMFPPIEGLNAAAAPAAIVSRPPNPSVVVHTRTADQLRAELAAAGVSAADIEDLLERAASAPLKSPSPTSSAVAQTTLPKQKKKTALESAPALSPAMADLLKMMSSGSAPPIKPVILPQFEKRKDKKPQPNTPR